MGVEVSVGVGVTVGVGVSVGEGVTVGVAVAVEVAVGVNAARAASSARHHQTATTAAMTSRSRRSAQGRWRRRRGFELRSAPHWKQSCARLATRAPQ